MKNETIEKLKKLASQHATEDGTMTDAWRAAIIAAMKEGQP